MLIRKLQTTLPQIFCKLILDFKFVKQNIIDPDEKFLSIVNQFMPGQTDMNIKYSYYHYHYHSNIMQHRGDKTMIKYDKFPTYLFSSM